MNLYLIHCGFYDADLCDGIFESHVNFFVAAENFEDARLKAKLLSEFKTKRMHIDGIQEIQAVSGFKINLEYNPLLKDQTHIVNFKHRDLAPKPTAEVDKKNG